MKEAIDMTDEYSLFKERIYRMLGVNLNLYKEAQMKRRLTSLKRKRGFSSFATYYKALKDNEQLLNEFVDRLTINVSEFYRNPKRWAVLQQKIFPELLKDKQKLSIWSAACSTGEEPYSLALMLTEHFPDADVHILATDIDENAIQKANDGIYQANALKGLPKIMKTKYFTKNNSLYHIDQDIKRMVTFKKHDLLRDAYPMNIDLLVCRNVLIYFTDEAKHMIYQKISNALSHQGILFVGSTEQIFNPMQYNLSVVDTFFYEKYVNHP